MIDGSSHFSSNDTPFAALRSIGLSSVTSKRLIASQNFKEPVASGFSNERLIVPAAAANSRTGMFIMSFLPD